MTDTRSQPTPEPVRQHTPTPWRYELVRMVPEAPIAGFGITSDFRHPNLPDDMKMHSIASANLYEHVAFTGCFTPEEIEANAAFICEAVNSHASLKARVEELEAALQPFAAFADPRNTIPPDTILTAGSAMARKQITMADCYAARDALARISAVARTEQERGK